MIKKAIFALLFIVLALEAKDTFKNFKEYQGAQAKEFKEYLDENDRLFKASLLGEWRAYKADALEPFFEDKKPSILPKATFKQKEPLGPKVFIDVDDSETKDLSAPKEGNLEFFGTKVSINSVDFTDKPKSVSISKAGINEFFNYLARFSYATLVEDIKNTLVELSLNDWGVYQLVFKVANSSFSDKDEAKLFAWLLLNKLGYDTKVGVMRDELVLLHCSKKKIYATPGYELNGKKYYVFGVKNSSSVYTYKDEYPLATKELDLSLGVLPKFSEDLQTKELSFTYLNDKYSFKFRYNKNLLDFMATYPQASYEVYFNSPLERITQNDLTRDFIKYLNGKKSSEALDFVLSFVQNAFIYELDDKQFAKEKSMFAMETLYYQGSDCEDRAVLFATLVKKLFNFEVVGLRYSDHMATALNVPLDGDKITIDKKEFVIADPTYINARVGQTMPKYTKIKPKSYIIVQ